MKIVKDIHFNRYIINGWRCPSCGEEYLDPEKAQKILLLNKLQKQKFHLKLSQIRSNLIVRIPKEVSDVLEMKNGEEIEFSLKGDKIEIHTMKT